jgi:hypothetical protein
LLIPDNVGGADNELGVVDIGTFLPILLIGSYRGVAANLLRWIQEAGVRPFWNLSC